MKHLLSNLVGFAVATTEGNQGFLRDFYFDDHRWVLRYLVCRMFSVPSRHRRTVLVSAEHVLPREWDFRIFPLALTSEQLRRCPGPESDPPVSKQRASEVSASILSPENGGIGTSGLMLTTVPYVLESSGTRADPRLRSFRAVRGYTVRCSEENIGTVVDFAVDDTDWSIGGVVIRLKSAKKGTVIVPPPWISEIDWFNGTFWTEAVTDQWRQAPRFMTGWRSAGPYAR